MSIIYKKNEDVVSRDIADETILVPIRDNLADMQKIFSVDSVAEHIWEKIDGSRDLNSILSSTLDSFDVVQEQAENDVVEFVNELENAGLIIKV